MSGIPEEKLVEAHGGFSTASCIRCSKKHDPHKTREDILQGKTVYCDRSFCKVRIYIHFKYVLIVQSRSGKKTLLAVCQYLRGMISAYMNINIIITAFWYKTPCNLLTGTSVSVEPADSTYQHGVTS